LRILKVATHAWPTEIMSRKMGPRQVTMDENSPQIGGKYKNPHQSPEK
jgi:hypothetical protein